MSTSTQETLNRFHKATRIVSALRKAGLSPAQMERASEETWQIAARAVGDKVPSEATRALVLDMLRSEKAGAE